MCSHILKKKKVFLVFPMTLKESPCQIVFPSINRHCQKYISKRKVLTHTHIVLDLDVLCKVQAQLYYVNIFSNKRNVPQKRKNGFSDKLLRSVSGSKLSCRGGRGQIEQSLGRSKLGITLTAIVLYSVKEGVNKKKPLNL